MMKMILTMMMRLWMIMVSNIKLCRKWGVCGTYSFIYIYTQILFYHSSFGNIINRLRRTNLTGDTGNVRRCKHGRSERL